MTDEQQQSKAHTIGLLFSPDLIYGTPLGKTITGYHFFDYDSAESLHLSKRERQMVTDTLGAIRFEMEQPVDKHSQTILTDRIKLILDYCQRFYDRQFITRHKENSDILSAFEQNIKEPNQIYILSAKYHLLNPEKIISPYNLTPNNLLAHLLLISEPKDE